MIGTSTAIQGFVVSLVSGIFAVMLIPLGIVFAFLEPPLGLIFLGASARAITTSRSVLKW